MTSIYSGFSIATLDQRRFFSPLSHEKTPGRIQEIPILMVDGEVAYWFINISPIKRKLTKTYQDYYWLVVYLPLRKILVNWDYYSQYMEK